MGLSFINSVFLAKLNSYTAITQKNYFVEQNLTIVTIL